ncbi:MAG: hypothetical protein WCD35_12605 [Mycobacteriales bacterium]
MKLSDLDDRFVPAVARRLTRWVEQLRVRREQARALARSLDRSSLRALDDRYTAGGPLALLREVPQLGFVLIGLVFLAGTATAVSQESDRARQRLDAVTVPVDTPELPSPAPDTVLGPSVGDTVAAYLRAAGLSVTEAGSGSARGSRVGLVSLTDYRTPAQVTATLRGYRVLRVFLRAKAGGKEAAQLPVDVKGDLLPALAAAYATTARGRLALQHSYQGYVDSLTVVTREDQQFKDLYAALARSTGLEARAYRTGCACVYSAVVEASAPQLRALAGRPGVRAVQVAAQGLGLRQLQVLPLLPETTGVVPRQQAPDGAQ